MASFDTYILHNGGPIDEFLNRYEYMYAGQSDNIKTISNFRVNDKIHT